MFMQHKKLTSNKFSIYQSYTIQDISRLVSRSTRTITSWIDNGLVPINPGGKPLYFKGIKIKKYITQIKANRKCVLKKHEFWCMKCHKATTAKEKSIQIVNNRRHALCSKCGTKINRFIRKTDVKERAP